MARKGVIVLVACLMLGAFLTMASSAGQGGDVIIIRPWMGETEVTQGQRVSAMNGWLSCSKWMDLDWRNAAIIHLELWRDGERVQVIEKGNVRWETTPGDADPLCLHVNSPLVSRWYGDLRLHRAGVYQLYWTLGTSVDLADGFDGDEDGRLDLYPAGTQDHVTTITVLPAGGHGG